MAKIAQLFYHGKCAICLKLVMVYDRTVVEKTESGAGQYQQQVCCKCVPYKK
jgi:hypothetical protein